MFLCEIHEDDMHLIIVFVCMSVYYTHSECSFFELTGCSLLALGHLVDV